MKTTQLTMWPCVEGVGKIEETVVTRPGGRVRTARQLEHAHLVNVRKTLAKHHQNDPTASGKKYARGGQVLKPSSTTPEEMRKIRAAGLWPRVTTPGDPAAAIAKILEDYKDSIIDYTSDCERMELCSID